MMTSEEWGEQTKKTFVKFFARFGDNPLDWSRNADRWHTAAKVLFEAASQYQVNEHDVDCPEYEGLDDVATTVYSFAMENALKAYLIKKHGNFEDAKQAYDKLWNRHRLLGLAEATGLPLTVEQKLLLATLEQFALWAGKYPTPNKVEQFTIKKQLASGDYLTPNALRPEDILMIDPFFKLLSDKTWEEAFARMDGVIVRQNLTSGVES